MKKVHKRLLGVGGLALVAAITTVAYNIPDAGAVSPAASGRVEVNANVISQNPEILINSPLDGAKLTSANLHIVARYANADRVEYILSSGDRSVTIPSPDLSGNATDAYGNNGEHDFYYNLKEFNPSTAGYGSYTLKAVVERMGSTVEDAVSFSYSPATVDGGSIPTDENNNPIVDINVQASVVKVMAIVEKADGTEAFRVTADTNGVSPLYMVLPFSNDQSLESGNYNVKFITYSYNGLGQLVADQNEATTNLRTRVTYEKKTAPEDELPPDDTPPTPLDPSAGDENNPVVPTPEGTKKDDIVHVIVKDPETGDVVLEGDFPVNEEGNVDIPFDQYNIPEGKYDIETIPYEKDPETGEDILQPEKGNESTIDYEGKTEENKPTTDKENGNPIIPIVNDGTVEKVKVVITDKEGNKTEIVVDVKPGQKDVQIPFDEVGLKPGDYEVTIITYSKDSETGKLAPNQNPSYVKPVDITFNGTEKNYVFVDSENKFGLHSWNRNSDAGEPLKFVIETADAFRFFDAKAVYLTTAGNSANLFNDANFLNAIYYTAEEGSLKLYLKSSYLATLPNGDYILGLKLTNGANPTVKFTIKGKASSGSSENPNPVININVEEGVEKVEIIVYDKDGKEIFRFETPVTSITTNHITLPFDLYNLPDGDYKIAVIPYIRNENGELVPLITEEEAKKNATTVGYGAPEVPNTGNFFAGLNLSQKDFLLTGLIIFGAVTAGGIVLLKKRESRR